MERSEILRRARENITLFGATKDEIEDALRCATREIERHVLRQELTYRQRHRKPSHRTDGMTHVRRKGKCPTKRSLR